MKNGFLAGLASIVLIACAFTLAVPQDASAHKLRNLYERNGPIQGSTCEDPRILFLIRTRFNQTQRRTFHRDVEIIDFNHLRPITTRYHEPAYHDRLYCEGRVILDNGRHHTLVYQRAFSARFPLPPLGAGLQFCVVGYDDYRAHAPACSQLRPR